MSNVEGIEEICRSSRSIFEQLLLSSGITSGVSGSCLFACIFLQPALKKFANCQVEICGGDGEDDGGIHDMNGRKHGHYWIEGESASGIRFLADITADQFGYEPVTVFCGGDPRWSRYSRGNAEVVVDHVQEMCL